MLALYAYNESLMAEPYEARRWDRWRQLQERIILQAERAEGFLGRYRGERDVLGYLAPRWPQEKLIMGNLSAWTGLRQLYNFTFGPGTHGGMIGSQFFEPWPHDRPHFVAWWGKAELLDDDTVRPIFDIDTALLMQGELHTHGPTANFFGWGGPK